MDKNKPVDILRDGNIKASIWRNSSENGTFYTTTLARTYSDKDGKPKDTHSIPSNDLLRASELSRQAYNRCKELRREHASDRDQFQQQRNQTQSQNQDQDRQR